MARSQGQLSYSASSGSALGLGGVASGTEAGSLTGKSAS